MSTSLRSVITQSIKSFSRPRRATHPSPRRLLLEEFEKRLAPAVMGPVDPVSGTGVPLQPASNPLNHDLPFAPITIQASQAPASPSLTSLSLPSSFDLRDDGGNDYVTPVENQGACGDCWAFAAYGSLESSILMDCGQSVDLSENNLKDYSGFDGPGFGGNSFMAEAYIIRGSGPVTNADDPYRDYDDRQIPAVHAASPYVPLEMLHLTTPTEMKTALMTYGALDSGMYIDGTNPDEDGCYNPTNYTYYYSGSEGCNHGITIVGWDDNMVTAGGTGAWLIKNSWGTGFGDNGYFWISYQDSQACKFAEAFCDPVPSGSLFTKVYDLAQYGDTGEINTPYGFNKYTTSASEKLQAVGFFTEAENASYTVTIYGSFSGSGLSDPLATMTGTETYAGYYTVALPSPVLLSAGQSFYVELHLTNGGDFPLAYSNRVSGYTDACTAQPGQSYSSFDGTSWGDMTSFDSTSSLCINAYTTVVGTDLTSAGFNVTSPNLQVNTSGTQVKFVIDNRGNTAAGTFNVQFYLSPNSTINPAADILLSLSPTDPHYNSSAPSAYQVAGLAAGSYLTATVTLVAPAQDPFGTTDNYTLGMVIDPQGKVTEACTSDQSNVGSGLDSHPVDYKLEQADFSLLNSSTDLPPGWSETDNSGSGYTWSIYNPQTLTNSNWTDGFMLIDSNAAGDVNIDTSLITRSINCTGYSNITLSFSQDFVHSGDESAEVDYEVDGGAWVTLVHYCGSDASGIVSLSLPAAANQANVEVRWHYYNACDDEYWGIDNVSITGTPNTPVVTNVTNVTATPASGTYTAGAVIKIAVAFNQPMTVTGTPQLSLNSGGTASYSSGSGTSTLTFTYTVGAGEGSTHLDYTSPNALFLNGANITEASSNPATLILPFDGSGHALGDNTTLVIEPTYLVTTANDNGIGSLRAAMNAATGWSGADIIAFAPSDFSTPQTITLGTSLPFMVVNAGTTIQGPTSAALTISGNNAYEVFSVASGASVTLSNLTIVQGLGTNGGGIYNDGTLTVNSCTLSSNTAEDGGAIFNDGSGLLQVTNSSLSGNSVSENGGAIYSNGSLTVNGCTLSSNSALSGGAIWGNSGTVALTDCTLSQNSCPNGAGGGICSDNTVTVTGCTLSSNSASWGGGINVCYGTVALTDCTLNKNYSQEGGGGIYSNSTVTVASCTLSGNTASWGGGIQTCGSLTLSNSIVANDTNSFDPDVCGTVQATSSYNLIGAGTSDLSGIGNGSNDNQIGTSASPINPLLGPLANNGGPTQTMALLSGSLARTSGDPNPTDLQGHALTTDQRGLPRIVNGHTDIGAFQTQPAPTLFSATVNGANVTIGGQSVSLAGATVHGGQHRLQIQRGSDPGHRRLYHRSPLGCFRERQGPGDGGHVADAELEFARRRRDLGSVLQRGRRGRWLNRRWGL